VAALAAYCVVAPALHAHAQAAPDQDIRREIQRRVETLRATGRLDIDGEIIRLSALLSELYERRGFAPVWTDRADARALTAFLAGVAADGLTPEHYHAAALGRHDSVSGAPARMAELDLLRTDAALRGAYHLRFGKVDAGRMVTSRSLDRALWGAAAVAAAESLLRTGQLAQTARALRPANFVYTGMVAALARLRAIERQGGWPTVAAGPRLELGSTEPRVAALRRRLVLSGDLAAADSSVSFAGALDAAVRSFQHRHALTVDGIVGPSTLAALNVPVSRRIEQLRVNLERARWIADDVADLFVVVNVPGALVYLIRSGEVQFEARVVVGKPYTRTPIFAAQMRYIELNPAWTVPPSIVREILAQIRRDPGYLRQQKIRVVAHSGREIAAGSIDFGRYSGATFPYVFRQDPGPLNPLGRIKFVFPNDYNVYLHDTPARELFQREQRTFSHGCVRAEHPLQLAELLLGEPDRWSVATLQQEIDRGTTQTIMLRAPVPVLILYWTAAADRHGELHFYPDVYERDAALLRVLNAA
jgi:murein L,D-transpeptidase YcbB/YkuD